MLRIVALGLAVTLSGVVPWAILAGANFKLSPAVPWSVPVMAAVLWFYWRFWRGDLGMSASAAERRRRLRANPVPPGLWKPAAAFFLAGFVAVNAIKVAINTAFDLPVAPAPDILKYPLLSVALYVFMISLVAAVTEEAGLRGYMQGPLEGRIGPWKAILAVGIVFWIGHLGQAAGRPDLFVISIWYFLATSALLGVMTLATNSILPALVCHFAGDFVYILASLQAGARGFTLEKVPANSALFAAAVMCAAAGVLCTAWAGRRLLKMGRPIVAPAALQAHGF